MKKMNKLSVAVVALAAFGLTSLAASAQTVTAGAQDLILGFQVAGSPTDLEVDLGSYTLYNNAAAGTTLNLSSLLSATDLTTLTSSFASTTSGTGVQWSVAGVTSNTVTNPTFDVTSTTTIKTASSAILTPPWQTISSLAGGLNGQPVASTSSSALIGTSSNPASGIFNSYTTLEAQGGTGYGFVPNAETVGASTVELYSFTPQAQVGTGHNAQYPAAIALGYFTLSYSNNVLGFTFTSPAAVPEPSAYALGICAILLFIVLKRRHSVV